VSNLAYQVKRSVSSGSKTGNRRYFKDIKGMKRSAFNSSTILNINDTVSYIFILERLYQNFPPEQTMFPVGAD
jgi:hypothetical protein